MKLWRLEPIPAIPPHLREAFEAERREYTINTLSFLLLYIACPLYLLFWSSDLMVRPESKGLSLVVRLSMVPITLLVLNLYKMHLFRKHFYIPVFIALTWSSIIANLLLIYLAGLDPTTYFSTNNLVATGTLIFLPLPLGLVIFELSIIYFPYLLAISLGTHESHLSNYLLNFNIMLGTVTVLLAYRFIQLKAIHNDFLNRQALLNDARVGENLSHITHDMKSSVQALMVVGESANISQEEKQILNLAVNRLKMLIGQATSSAGILFLNKKKVKIKEILNESKLELVVFDKFTFINWKEVPDGGEVNVDGKKIVRVLVNLVSNAFRAVENKTKPIINVTVLKGDNLAFIVEDNGIGIKDEEIKLLFSKGYSAFGSTGLGLYFCKSVALAHQGDLSVEREDELTRFIFSIPL